MHRSSKRKGKLTGGLTRSRDRIQRCGNARTAMQETQQRHSTTAEQRNSARDTAEQDEQNAADRISHRKPHAVCGSTDTAKLANRPDRENAISDMLLLSRV